MSISGQNLSIVIVTLKSKKVIYDCINSINQNVPIIVVEQSNNQKFKDELESKYKNLKCILSKSNLGMGTGNNIGIKETKTDYVLILNPDVILEKNALEKNTGNFLAFGGKFFALYRKNNSEIVEFSPKDIFWEILTSGHW